MSVKFVDNTIQVKSAIDSAVEQFLHEAAGEVKSRTQSNTSVDTGDLKSSWNYRISVAGDEAQIGSNEQNAIWEEFGTGEHAINGGGRTSPWYVPVEGYTGSKKPTFQGEVVIVHGKNCDFYKTDGKVAKRPLQKAYTSSKGKIIRRAEKIMQERLK